MREVAKNIEIRLGYNSILFSVYKALIIFNMLSEAPCTMKEIKEALAKIPFTKRNISDDSVRVYMNSLIKSGCKIEKELTHTKHRQYTYRIAETPFKPKISKNQMDKMFDLYDICTYNMPFDKLLEIDFFYRRLAKYLNESKFMTEYEKHSKLEKFAPGLLKTLLECTMNNDVVTVLYESPHSGLKEIEIIAYEICIRNYKLYLKGFGKEYQETAIFLIDRIKNIVNIAPYDNSDKKQTLPDMIYELYDFYEPLDEDEEIIETTKDYRKIRRKVKNKMLTFQRILQFGGECKVLEPEIYKNEIIKTLKAMKEVYGAKE